MEDRLIELLSTFGFGVYRQGSLAGKPYPAAFFTFWNDSSEDGNHYDNEPLENVERFDVNFYSTDPEHVYTTLASARALLLENDFMISGTGYDVPSDEDTHTGRGFLAIYETLRRTTT